MCWKNDLQTESAAALRTPVHGSWEEDEDMWLFSTTGKSQGIIPNVWGELIANQGVHGLCCKKVNAMGRLVRRREPRRVVGSTFLMWC